MKKKQKFLAILLAALLVLSLAGCTTASGGSQSSDSGSSASADSGSSGGGAKDIKDIVVGADAMIVIGGKHSSNTRKLYDICREVCDNTYFIQTLDDLHLELPKSAGLVGITAGASTPNKLIEEVQNYVRINF